MVTSLAKAAKRDGFVLGIAPHSLRAVSPGALHEVLAAAPAQAPVHIHAAEQLREVHDSIAWSGERPVEWLLNHADVDARWAIVHATHATHAELDGLVARGATVGWHRPRKPISATAYSPRSTISRAEAR